MLKTQVQESEESLLGFWKKINSVESNFSFVVYWGQSSLAVLSRVIALWWISCAIEAGNSFMGVGWATPENRGKQKMEIQFFSMENNK